MEIKWEMDSQKDEGMAETAKNKGWHIAELARICNRAGSDRDRAD